VRGDLASQVSLPARYWLRGLEIPARQDIARAWHCVICDLVNPIRYSNQRPASGRRADGRSIDGREHHLSDLSGPAIANIEDVASRVERHSTWTAEFCAETAAVDSLACRSPKCAKNVVVACDCGNGSIAVDLSNSFVSGIRDVYIPLVICGREVWPAKYCEESRTIPIPTSSGGRIRRHIVRRWIPPTGKR
jgi:hypothetical protein